MQSEHSALQCPHCSHTYDLLEHHPRMLPQCGHTLCSSCLLSLLQQPQLKCPLDQSAVGSAFDTIDHFPVNYIAKQLVEINSKYEVCEIHGNRKEVLCLTDRERVCSFCALFSGHRDHNLKHIKEIQSEFNTVRKQLKINLENIEEHQRSLEEVLDKERATLQKIIEDRYEELAFLLKMKKLGLLFELDNVFRKSKAKINNVFGKEAPLSTQILHKLSEYKEVPKTDELFSLLNIDLSEFRSQLDNELLKTQVQELDIKLQEATATFKETMSSQIALLTKFEVLKRQDFTEKIEEQATVESKEDASTNINASLSYLKIESSFEFETCNGYLEIMTTNNDATNVLIDAEEWKKMKEVRFKLDRFALSEEDIKALDYIWMKLEHVRCIRIDASFQKNIQEENLISLFSIIFSRPQAIREIEINLGESNVGDEAIVYLAEHVLSNLSNLKVMSLNLSSTAITDRSVKQLATCAFPVLKTLESFMLHLGGTEISEEVFAEIFISFPTVGLFEIGLSSTRFGNAGLNAFIRNTLPSMTSLKRLKMRLWKTNVTDESVYNLFENMPDLRTFSLDFGSNRLTDQGVKNFVDEKLPTMKNLKDFKLYLYDTKVTEQIMAKIYQIKRTLSG